MSSVAKKLSSFLGGLWSSHDLEMQKLLSTSQTLYKYMTMRRKGNSGFKTLSTFDFVMVALTLIVHLMADRQHLHEKWSLCLVDLGIGEKTYIYIFSSFP